MSWRHNYLARLARGHGTMGLDPIDYLPIIAVPFFGSFMAALAYWLQCGTGIMTGRHMILPDVLTLPLLLARLARRRALRGRHGDPGHRGRAEIQDHGECGGGPIAFSPYLALGAWPVCLYGPLEFTILE